MQFGCEFCLSSDLSFRHLMDVPSLPEEYLQDLQGMFCLPRGGDQPGVKQNEYEVCFKSKET